jgi:hypothetical protein
MSAVFFASGRASGAQRVAGFERDQFRDLLRSRFHRVGDLEEHAPPVARHGPAPGGEGARRRLHRAFDIRFRAARHLGDGHALRRILDRDHGAGRARHPLAVDQHLTMDERLLRCAFEGFADGHDALPIVDPRFTPKRRQAQPSLPRGNPEPVAGLVLVSNPPVRAGFLVHKLAFFGFVSDQDGFLSPIKLASFRRIYFRCGACPMAASMFNDSAMPRGPVGPIPNRLLFLLLQRICRRIVNLDR